MPKTLLLADDSVVIQKLVGLSFANEDVELVTVDNGDDAIARAHELSPDLVLADVVMPGKSGYEVCEAIKSDPQRAHIPVLLLTGTFEAFDEARAQATHADGHITKPFEAQALVDRVNELLARAAQPAAAAPVQASPIGGGTADFFDENMGNLADSLESPGAPASADADFAFGGESTPPFDTLSPFENPSGDADNFDLSSSLDGHGGGLDLAGPALGGLAGDETVAIMPGPEGDPLANTADMPTPPLGVAEIPLPTQDDLGATVLADESFAAPIFQAAPPEPPTAVLGDESFGSQNTAPLGSEDERVQAPPAMPEVPLPPASQEPPPLPGTLGQSDPSMDLDDLSFGTPPPLPAQGDPGETMLSEDLFAGAPPLSEQPVVDLDATPRPGTSGLDLDFDAPSPEPAAGRPPMVPDSAGDYDVSSSDLGPAPLVGRSAWDASASLGDAGEPRAPRMPEDPFPRAGGSDPLPSAQPGDSPLGAEAPPVSDSPSFGAAPMDAPGEALSSPPPATHAESPFASPEPDTGSDWLLSGEPLGQANSQDMSRPRQEPAAPAPTPSETHAPAQDPASSSALITTGKPDLSPMLRDRVHDTLEKVAWEAFSDLSESVVRDVLKRVEQIAWEVIPQMTEAMVREEIRRMKGEDEDKS